jgi:hypothetical protein
MITYNSENGIQVTCSSTDDLRQYAVSYLCKLADEVREQQEAFLEHRAKANAGENKSQFVAEIFDKGIDNDLVQMFRVLKALGISEHGRSHI